MSSTGSTNSPTTVTTGPEERDHAVSRRAAVSSLIGTTIEWYDYFLYGTAAAIVFPTVFFHSVGDSGVGTFLSLATFAVAFVLRPLGGVIFGHYGDKLGRKKMLIITLLGMSLCTALIGAIPSYNSIGVAAPVLLIVMRVIQGFALGGEWGGAALMSVEHAPTGKRGFYGSTMQMGVPAGLLLSTGAFTLVSSLPDEQFFAWGWRLPFLFGLALLVVGLYIRLNVTEPPAFAKLDAAGEKAKLPIREVLEHEKKKTVIMVFFQSVANVGYFLITVYSLTYVTEVLDLPRSWAVTGLLLAAGVDLIMQPIFGTLSDKVGRKVVCGFGAVFFGVFAFPFFWLLDTGNEYLIWTALILGLGIGHASTGSLHGVIYAEQYKARYRYTGSSVAYQLSGIISSGPTPIVAAALVSSFGSSRYVAGYVVLAAVISFICVLLVRETSKDPIDV